jgi:hypothetical protein
MIDALCQKLCSTPDKQKWHKRYSQSKNEASSEDHWLTSDYDSCVVGSMKERSQLIDRHMILVLDYRKHHEENLTAAVKND